MNSAKLWIGLSALASLAGWSLSAAGQLNRAGYLVFSDWLRRFCFSAAAKFIFVFRRSKRFSAVSAGHCPSHLRRWRCWFLLAASFIRRATTPG
jgi:uncharacterized membrane protein YhdT